jgi:hypothetical protein
MRPKPQAGIPKGAIETGGVGGDSPECAYGLEGENGSSDNPLPMGPVIHRVAIRIRECIVKHRPTQTTSITL